jgi:sugar lactone lactonase YvrE
VAPDGGLLVSTGLHVRTLYRVAPDGAVSVVAGELGDPNGVIVDRTGAIYVAETALHRIVRIVPVTPPPASRR